MKSQKKMEFSQWKVIWLVIDFFPDFFPWLLHDFCSQKKPISVNGKSFDLSLTFFLTFSLTFAVKKNGFQSMKSQQKV